MTVLMTADAVGGVWTYALDLARAMESAGVEVVLAVLGPSPSEAQRDEAQCIANLRVIEHPCRLEWMPDAWNDVDRSGEWLRALAGRIDPDVVHLNGYAHGAIDFGVPSLVVAHSCVLSWWRAVRREPWSSECRVYEQHVMRGLAGAHAIVAPTLAMAAEIVTIYRPARDVRVIYNGHTLTAGGHSLPEPLIFSAGRLWDEAKNVKALQHVAPRVPWPIYVAGDGANGARFSHCTSVGRLLPAEVTTWMQRASIYAAPARYEPFGLSILEAASCECALVLGDIPSLRELWHDCAWFVDPDDADELADALSHAIRHRRVRRRLAAHARDRAAEFTAVRMGRAYLELYEELRRAANAAPGEHSCAS